MPDPKIRLSTASDYAVLKVGALEFYYGYEYGMLMALTGVPTDADAWGFIVRQEHMVIYHRAYEAGIEQIQRDRESTAECLLVGIGFWIDDRQHGG